LTNGDRKNAHESSEGFYAGCFDSLIGLGICSSSETESSALALAAWQRLVTLAGVTRRHYADEE
jgi:hypothetical protein